MSINHGAVWWSELMTRDPEAAVRYYTDVCGWSFDTIPSGDAVYYVAIAHGRPIAGITGMAGMEGVEDKPHWFTYFAVDDVDAAMEQTRFAGGEVLRAPLDVPEVGRVGLVRDPTGAAVGLMRPVFPGDALAAADAASEEGSADTPIDEDENFPV